MRYDWYWITLKNKVKKFKALGQSFSDATISAKKEMKEDSKNRRNNASKKPLTKKQIKYRAAQVARNRRIAQDQKARANSSQAPIPVHSMSM